ncbi:MAG: dihydroxy-acid dehydratase [Devosia sp.]|uniref:L-arabinonate dehydratase n=1 Tax=Devosia sp. 66-22 TaxID=1895753 RepID=UPI0009282F06|nr:L-arabinonate dehydratase [Devosia sp. 66-22]MBN9344862.1 dihydroxy-acid dehydratase [Devosia sp.]OJX47676.1 MAG: dihydroxy-acid dehydratase [Devosia sp. 66-22]
MKKLRSAAWFGGTGKNAFIHRSWMKNSGHPEDMFEGRPVIGICNTASDLTPCNAHFRQLIEPIKRGIYEAGGFPVEFPVFSCGEPNLRPTAMMFRNLASMDVEEAIRANPIDGVVLLCGCDKTTPSLVMGASSCDLPTIVLSGGPMLNGMYKGRKIGSGTDVFRLSEEVRAGTITMDDFLDAESSMSRSPGHCMTMGTASTMASMVEALGLALPGNAAIPAVDARRARLAHLTGRRIVDMVREDLKLSKILTREAFENAVKVNGAIGGSTNAVVHLLAIAGRIQADFKLEDWDRFGRDVPTIANLKPSGAHLMEDFFYAGGIPALMHTIRDRLQLGAMTVTGRTVGDNIADAEVYLPDVIRPLDQPLVANGGIVVLRGNLAPGGAVLKPSAATPELLEHRGRAVVFDTIEEYRRRIADPDLAITADSVMVLRNCGPKGYPGMAEVGNMGLPPKLLQQGVRDMVRISDARMSGTAYGTVVLHTSPEAAAGGTLALVREGDEITLSVSRRELTLHVSEDELARRRAEWVAPEFGESGYRGLYRRHVMQADTGADFDFLLGCRGAPIPEESH